MSIMLTVIRDDDPFCLLKIGTMKILDVAHRKKNMTSCRARAYGSVVKKK